MGALIYAGLSLFATSLLARLLIGGGITLLVSSGLSAAVDGLLSSALSSFGGLPELAYQLFLMGGIGTAFSVIGGAVITRVALLAAGRVLGITMGGGA